MSTKTVVNQQKSSNIGEPESGTHPTSANVSEIAALRDSLARACSPADADEIFRRVCDLLLAAAGGDR